MHKKKYTPKPVAILGSHITQFGELWSRSIRDLLYEAMEQAVVSATKSSGISTQDIDAVYVSNMASGGFENQRHLNALASQFFEHQPPAYRVESACASGGMALILANDALQAQRFKTILVVGVEKMTDVSPAQATQILASAADMEFEYGSTFPGLYGLLAQAHMDAFGTTRDQLSAVAVKNHAHGVTNPQAQFRRKMTIDQVSQSPLIADPLRLLDCSPISDGAAAVVLRLEDTTNAKRAYIVGQGHGQDSLDLASRSSLTELPATRIAAKQAFSQANTKPSDIQAVELHDCFTIAEILATEDLGFCNKGSGGTMATDPKNGIVINPSGGLKACGHPIGATGIKQVAYLSKAIESGVYQQCLTHNVGGSGATAIVHILKAGSSQK